MRQRSCQLKLHTHPQPDEGWFFTVRGAGQAIDGVYSNGGKPYKTRAEVERVARRWLERQGLTVESLTSEGPRPS